MSFQAEIIHVLELKQFYCEILVYLREGPENKRKFSNFWVPSHHHLIFFAFAAWRFLLSAPNLFRFDDTKVAKNM